jgi:hypothetical protein
VKARLALALALVGCGAAPPVRATEAPPASEVVAEDPVLPPLTDITLRSSPAAEQRVPLVIDLGADGSIETACGATRLSPEGELFRGDERVARLVRVDGALTVRDAQDHDTGLRIEEGALVGPNDTRFALASGTVTPSDPAASPIGYAPADAPPRLVLGVLALALVCTDETL